MGSTKVQEVLFGRGHENIEATHRTTFEFTKNQHLSKKGTCIVAVAIDKNLVNLSSKFKENLRKKNSKLEILIEAGGTVERIRAQGFPKLLLSHSTDIVVRTSNFVSDRTLAINANKAANDLSRVFVEKLRSSEQEVKITLTVIV